jgi:acyl carrier protein
MIQLKTPERAASVLASKLKGVQVLDRLFNGSNLDFLVLCSSLSSVLGGIGQVDYCAGNAFLDAFAISSAATSNTFTVSINWDSWQEVGMAVNKNWRKELLEQGISSAEGVAVFDRILSAGLSQVIASTRDLQARLHQAYAAIVPDATPDQSLYQRPQLDTDYVAPRDEIDQTIAAIWQDILGIEQVGIYDNFFDLGGHSLLVTQLISRLHAAFRVELPMQALFESRTIADSAAVVSNQLFGQTDRETLDRALAEIEQLSSEEVLALLGNDRS